MLVICTVPTPVSLINKFHTEILVVLFMPWLKQEWKGMKKLDREMHGTVWVDGY